MPVALLSEIAKELTFSHELLGYSLEPYFSVAHILRDALFQQTVSPVLTIDSPSWLHATRYALEYFEQKNPLLSVTHAPQAKHLTFAHAIKFLSKKNINLELIGDSIVNLTANHRHLIAALLEQPFSRLGGYRVMSLVGETFENRCNYGLRRILLHPTPDMMGQKIERSTPYGYIYRMALRTLGQKGKSLTSSISFSSIENSAKHIGAIFDVEPFSIYENMDRNASTKILQDLQKIILYDELFTVPQCVPDVMSDLLTSLLNYEKITPISSQDGWTSKDVLHLWDVLLDSSNHLTKSTFIPQTELLRRLSSRVGPMIAAALLPAFLIKKANANYKLPIDAKGADTRECAMALSFDRNIWIAPQLFLGPAFYARLFSVYGSISKSFSGHIGMAFERRMQKRLDQLGINYIRGDIVASKNIAGDADLIIETADTVILFELKKKGLRRETIAGNDLQLAIDLSQGLIKGVNQLARQELILVKKETLRFKNGETLELKGRRLFKAVMSLVEYGGLHEVTTMHRTLRSLCGVSLNAIKPITEEQRQDLLDTNATLEEFGKNFSNYRDAIGDSGSDMFFENTLFHNIFFIEHILKKARTADEFVKSFLSTSRIITGTRDAIVDHNYFNAKLQQ